MILDLYNGVRNKEYKIPITKHSNTHLNIFILAESLGGVESLICHPAEMTHASLTVEKRKELGISDGLLRLSIGVEDSDDLINDLSNALKYI